MNEILWKGVYVFIICLEVLRKEVYKGFGCRVDSN